MARSGASIRGSTLARHRRRRQKSKQLHRLLQGEQLESRDLLALSPQFLGDLNTAPAGVTIRSPIVEVGGVGYFSGGYGLTDYELWKTDGTTAGTVLVKDIYPGTFGSRPDNLFNFNGTLFFSATSDTSGAELWKTDGTAAGTVLVKDISSGFSGSSPDLFTEMNGKLYFTAFDFDAGTELWKTDGTEAGTARVRDIVPGFFSPSISELVNFNGTLYFNAQEAIFEENDGMQLWKSDGTEAGTTKVTSITGGIFGLNPELITKVGTTLYFTATDGALGTELWKSDGTAAGTSMVVDMATGVFSSFISYLTNLNGTLIFKANGSSGTELYKTDGTAAGTVVLKDISTSSSFPTNVVNVGGTLYFTATDGTNGFELWKSDGTANGTVLVKDIAPNGTNSNPDNFTRHGSWVYFTANINSGFTQLWRTDGTSDNTALVAGSIPASSTFDFRDLTSVASKLLFSVNDGIDGFELWASAGAAADTQKVARNAINTASSGIADLTVVGSTAYFTAYDPATGRELWKTDGTAAGTARLDLAPGSANASVGSLVNLNGTLLFSANMGGSGSELWKTDGTLAGTTQVRDILTGPQSSAPYYLTNVNGVVFFSASDGVNGAELWKTDGTSGGTQLVKDIRTNVNGSFPKLLTNVNGRLFFVANDGTNGTELWTSDGTPGGTIFLKNIASSSASATLSQMTAVGSTLFFVANDGTNGNQLWKSNGTPAGTVLVRSIASGSVTPAPANFVNVSGTLFFAANDGTSGVELWKSDGTSGGTSRVKDIKSGSDSSTPGQLTNFGGTLYFRADDGNTATEIWKSDGTSAGTLLVKETMSGLSSGGPGDFSSIRGSLLLTASVGTGRELWASDGTAVGTLPILDIAPGLLSSSPRDMVSLGRTVLFTADNGTHGRELWSIYEPNAAPSGTNRIAPALEDTSYTLSLADFGFSDSGNVIADRLARVRLGSLPIVGDLRLSGTPVQVAQFISAAELASGLLVYTPPPNINGNGLASLTFGVQDDGGTADGGSDFSTSLSTLAINVASINDAPSGNDRTLTVFDHQPHTFSAADFGFSDSDTPQNTYLTVKVVSLPATGTLTAGGSPVSAGAVVGVGVPLVYTPLVTDFGSQLGYASFTFQVKDNGGTANGGIDTDPTANTISIDLKGTSTPPASSDKSVTTLEDTPHTFTSGDFSFSDVGDSPANSFQGIRITAAPASGNLAVGGVNVSAGGFVSFSDLPLLTFTPAANVFGTAQAKFTFQVQDNGGTADGGSDLDPTPNTLTINVTSVSDAPLAISKSVSLIEDVARTFTTPDFGFSDPLDSPANTLASVLITTPPASAGVIRLAGTPQPPGTQIVVVAAQIGQLSFVPAANLNSNNAAAPLVTFRVQDNGGTGNGGENTSQLATLSFNVTPINDAPRGAFGNSSVGITLLEENVHTFSVTDFGFTDPNDNPPDLFFVVRIVSQPQRGTLYNGISAVSTGTMIPLASVQSGAFRYIPQANVNGVDAFTFRVQDSGGTASGGIDLDSVSRTMSISITSVNDAPFGADKIINPSVSFLLEENGTYTFSAFDFGYSDPADAPSNIFSALRVTTLPTRGTLLLAGNPVAPGQFIPATSLSNLLFVPAPNESGMPYATFPFQVQDNGGTADGGVDTDPTPNTITLNVRGFNHPPQGAGGGAGVSVATGEDVPYTFALADFGFIDPDDAPPDELQAVRVVIPPQRGTLRNGAMPVGTGGVVTRASIDAGQFRFVPALNGHGVSPAYDSFLFRVQDDGGTASGGFDLDGIPRAMSITVTPQNDEPVGVVDDFIVREDEDLVFTGAMLVANDTDVDGDALRGLVGMPANGRTSHGTLSAVVGPGDGNSTFTYRPDPNFHGTDTIVYQAFDEIALSSFVTITIQVTPVNDEPGCQIGAVPAATDESGLISVPNWLVCSPGPADEQLQQVVAVVQRNTNPALFAAAPTIVNGTLSFTPKPNKSGSAEIELLLRDDGGTDNGGDDTASPLKFTIVVTKPHPLHNIVKPLDVTGDGHIVAADALEIINYINAFRSGSVSAAPAGTHLLDTSGDGFIAANDVLDIINHINSFGPDAEGETVHSSDSSRKLSADLLALLAADIEYASKRRR